MSTISFVTAMRQLPATDRALLIVLVACALVSLALGTIFGASTGLVRSGPARSRPGARLSAHDGARRHDLLLLALLRPDGAAPAAFAAAYGSRRRA